MTEREAQLLREVEELRHQKEKELVTQKHQLEFLLVGIRESGQFGEVLVKEGNKTEIAGSQKDVTTRLTTLDQEKKQSPMEPVTDATIEFESAGLSQGAEVIKVFGSVISKDVSVENSSIEGQPTGSITIKQPVSFRVIVVDKKGNRVASQGKKSSSVPFVVNITLDGTQQSQFTIEEIQGKGGEFSISFTPTTAGQHQFSVSHKGKHFKGSPIAVKVVDGHVFRRDYNTVGDQAIKKFGSGSFQGIVSNSKGEIFVVDTNGCVQVFDKSGSLSFKFGSSGNGNGQFNGPYGVTVDHRNDQIVVADTGNHRIQIFDSKGQFIRAFGSSGNGDGQLNEPYSVVVDPQGNYFVLDRNNHRVSVFDSDGRVVRKFGTNGNGNGNSPTLGALGCFQMGTLSWVTMAINVFKYLTIWETLFE